MTSKYRNVKTIVDGKIFDSKREAARYCELKLLAKSRVICSLKLQPKFILQEAFRDERVGVTKSGKSKMVRAIEYTADFQYMETATGRVIVEDVKSPASKTQAYEIRKRLFLKRFPKLDFREV